MNEDALLYVVQKAFIRKENEVLVLNDPREGLDFPGGKIQEGERDLIAALKREVLEETKLEIKVGKPFITWTEAYPEDHRLYGHLAVIIGYMCEFLSGSVQLSEEHDAFTWVNRHTYVNVNDGTSYFAILEKYFENPI